MGEQKGISVFAGIIASTKILMDSGEYVDIRDSYRATDLYDKVDRSKFDHHRAIELDMAGKLAENMCNEKANLGEIRRLVVYAYLLIDAFHYKLDFTKAAKDLNIKELKDKYMFNKDNNHDIIDNKEV